jgi:transposase
MSAGTLSGGLQAISPLFAPVKEAFIDKLRSQLHWHADETRWAVFMHALYRAGHHWYLWVFHAPTVVHYVLHPSRAAQVVIDELQGVKSGIISCDRYSAYKKFARLNPGVVLAFCWAHQRRDFLDLATRHPGFEAWALQWVSDIGQLYHLNAVRLQTTLQSAERDAAQIALEQGMQRMAASLGEALADPALGSPARKVLQSMKAHWSGLSVFVKHPWVPMDNNVAERDERGPVVGRKNFYGSGAQWAGELAALMYSVFATLKLWGINPNTWLFDYLQACAENVQRATSDISRFLPWAMDEARLAAMRNTQPAPVALAEVFDSS